MISSTDYSDVNSSGGSDNESIKWECGPSGDLNFFSNRRKVNTRKNKHNVQEKPTRTISRIPAKSSHRQGVTPLPKIIYEIQNPSINSVFDEIESIPIDVQSGAETDFENEKETYEFVFIDETTDNYPSETPSNPRNDPEVNNASEENTKVKRWPTIKTAKDAIVKQIIFLCDNCDISFTSNEDLKEHYATSETCSKKYKCFLCPFSADRNPTINLHLAFEHNRTEVYSCYHCSIKTGSKQELKLHIKNKHFKELSVDEVSQLNKHKKNKPSASNRDYNNGEITENSKKRKLRGSNKTNSMIKNQMMS